ncbi:MAG: coenzyme F420-0:L-glutamate ligase [Limnochordia bacterium]|jgi:F420-0:gamma-glutamyl ligase
MKTLPGYIGSAAFGIKMGIFVPGSDLIGEIASRSEELSRDGLLDDGDVICITESVVARVQNNIVTVEQVAAEVKEKLGLEDTSTLGVVYPIASRNRFSVVLQGLAKAVPKGKVVVQFSYPNDEVGNQVIDPAYAAASGGPDAVLYHREIPQEMLLHPVTRIDYGSYYKEIIGRQGAQAVILYANDPLAVMAEQPDGVIAADIRTRRETQRRIQEELDNCITLQDLCSNGEIRSEWGLLGSNMSSDGKLKLAPRDCEKITQAVQSEILQRTGRTVEVLIYGDGAYKDPATGIYELADPVTTFGSTPGLRDQVRCGVKYKMLVDHLHAQGKSFDEIERAIKEAQANDLSPDSMTTEGTTPRRLKDILATLADLVSGSADAGTPVVLIKGIYQG